MDSSFFVGNRNRLVTWLAADGPILIKNLHSGPGLTNANFWYLCGLTEPGWELIIDCSMHKTWLIAPDIDEIGRIFNGSLTLEDAKKISGVDEAVDYKVGIELKKQFSEAADYKSALAKLRAIKQPEELELMKEAARLTIEVFDLVKSKLSEYNYEFQIEADITHHFRWHNATHAFNPIVANGQNACTLHFEKNNSKLNNNQLLLTDIGARVGGYAADITRTFAIGEPSRRQIEVHEAVQFAQQQIIDLIRPGMSTMDYTDKSDIIMMKALVSCGLMNDENDEAGFRRYFPHSVSHGLGIEVHESLGGYKELMPGMVLTVEPGIYIPEEGIGVRIEDNILITEKGHTNLTEQLSTNL